jgi:hypothetical protein
MRCSPSLALTFVLALTATLPAHAEDAQAQAMGRALFNEGVALMSEGKYSDACPKLEASLKAFPGIGTRGKLAECYEKQGKFVSAWTTYREVAQLAMRGGDINREQVASERAKVLEPKLSYVTVSIPPANDLPGLVVRRRGQEIDRSKMNAAEPVDAGTIAFEVLAPGRKPFLGHVTITPGQSARFEVPLLEPEKTAAAPPTATASGMERPPPPAVRTEGSPLRPIGLAIAIAGLAGIGVGTFFGLKASSTYDAPFEDGRCDDATKQCDASGQSAIEDARKQATVSTFGFVTGGVLLVGGAALFLFAPTGKGTSLRVAPTAYASGGGARFDVVF